MNKYKFSTAIAVTVLLSLAGCGTSDPSSPSLADPAATATSAGSAPAPADKQPIIELHAAVDAAWNAGDANAFAALWTEDGTVTSPLGQLTEGRPAIRTDEAAQLAGPMKGTRHKLTVSRVYRPTPDVAVADGEAQISGFHDASGKIQPPLTAKFTSVCIERQGQWRISHLRSYVYIGR
jgi:uncharacterized protein (TIGR02246 family)